MLHWKSQTFSFAAGLATALLLFFVLVKNDMEKAEAIIDPGTVAEAQKLLNLHFNEAKRDSMMNGLQDNLGRYASLRGHDLPNEVIPALRFDPFIPGRLPDTVQMPLHWRLPESVVLPDDRNELAFFTVEKLAALMRDRKITSMELTELFFERISRYDDKLLTVVTLTKEIALEQARRADDEMARGMYRGPLHGIPYGSKDLLALEGYPATWGSEIYRDQMIDGTAMVIRKLEEAGAVHIAKMSLGELAWGDVWFGGMTRSPWNTDWGSSGSSAGSASAVAAGLVAFAIGSETLGSIVSPSTRNGVTGLRPSFGRVSRQGAMALSWSMDKIGPITRSAHDAAIVFSAMHGSGVGDYGANDIRPSGSNPHRDPTVFDYPFNYNPDFDFANRKIGYVEAAFEMDYGYREFDRLVLDVLKSLGAELVPISLPDLPLDAMSIILTVEAAAAFDELTRSGRDSLMVRQIKNAWPNVFRTARFVPAVEYIQANRMRTLLMHQMKDAISGVDVYVSPSFAGGNLLITNLTGHPAVSVPTGFDPETGLPASITFNGHLFDEGTVLSLARAFQDATGHHQRIPESFLDANTD